MEATLQDEAWKLALRLEPRAPTGTLAIHGQPYPLTDVTLDLIHEEVTGSIARDGGSRPAHTARAYRLRFALDACEHEPVTLVGRWPGPCGYLEGQPRPQKLTPYELLIDVDGAYWATGELHRFTAACVPRSGAGPSCKLEGTAVLLDR